MKGCIFDKDFQKYTKEREEAKNKRAVEDPYYARALTLTKKEREDLIRKSNQEFWPPFRRVLTDDERELSYRIAGIRYEDGEDWMEGAAVAALLGGLAAMAGGVAFPNGLAPELAQ